MQLSFLPKIRLTHGGAKTQGKRKIARPIDPKRPLHVVLKSSRAKGEWSMLHPKKAKHVDTRSQAIAKKWGIRIYRQANVGNHIHFLLSTPSRRAFQGFLRELSGTLAMLITGAHKGNPVGKFWDQLAYSAVVQWGRHFRNVTDYVIKNLFESAGFLKAADKARFRLIWIKATSPPPLLAT
jgi:REP element-mobilizing transposase RayT